MTNLLEKALITGFGIFILTIFISIINPFIIIVSNFNETISVDIDECENFFFERFFPEVRWPPPGHRCRRLRVPDR